METLTSTVSVIDLTDLTGAYGQADFALVASILVSLLAMGVRMTGLGHLLAKDWWRWIALGMGIVAGVVLGVTVGKPWTATIVPALMIGVLAVGQWEVVLGPMLDRMGLKQKLLSPPPLSLPPPT